MASQHDPVIFDYDEQNDVLYASRGSPQAVLSYEISKDIWLDYVPPNRTVMGITILSFSQHFPVPEGMPLLIIASAAVQELLQRYSSVPSDVQHPYVQISTSTVCDARPDHDTRYVGVTPAIESFRIQSSPVHAGAQGDEGDDAVS